MTGEHLGAIIDYGIMGILGMMSVAALAIAIERFITYRRIRPGEFPEKALLEIEVTRRLHLIATIGSNAPYVGLLGTVLGIMLTFYTMGREGFLDSGRIMTGLALALKATAAGLLVAIPAVVLYNLLLRKAKVLLMRWEIDRGRKGD
ncbi:MAG: TonB-system energizer ExbB [Syntrophales bacterium]|nr:TonB-system energizer ExbB [Syntrophales bacterium]